MAYFIKIPNPYQPLKDVKKFSHPGGISVRQWLESVHPGFKEFDTPTICLVNGEARLRKDWNLPVQNNDVVTFVGMPGGFVTIIVVVLVVALVVFAFLFLPTLPGTQPESDPVYSVKGRGNQIRLGEPIEVSYGKNRIYPSFASRPYYQYVNNDQFQFGLYCLGQGLFEIHNIQIGDTDINSYDEVEYEVIPPGSSPTLFPSNVITSLEAGGQTLYGPNEPEYEGDGWVGPFPVNPPNTQAYKIEVDLAFPQGLVRVRSSGLRNWTAVHEMQARLIDNAGAPLGDWFALTTPSPISTTARVLKALRLTFSKDVPPGRYEVRVRRINSGGDNAKIKQTAEWDGLRGFIDSSPDYGDVTLVAVKIRATANLNDRTQTAFNVIATRKLPIREGGVFTAPQATRSIVWAYVDLFRSSYGGRIDEDYYFDWPALLALDALYEERGDTFDWVFRDPITVWDAAKTIARCGRAAPLIAGSLITMKRDGPLDVPVAMFTPDNIVKGSFVWEIKLWEQDEHDSIQIEYIEPETGYKAEQVTGTLPGGTTDNPRDLKLPGANREQAYREALYIAATERYVRENIVFETGLEGNIVTFGDLIAVRHDVPRWGQSGVIVHAEDQSDGQYHLWLSEPLVWQEGETHRLLLRTKTGDILGPLVVQQTADPMQVLVELDDPDFDFLLGGTTEPMLFLFGISNQITKYGKIVKIEPAGGEVVRITAVNDAPLVHSFDELEAPPLDHPTTPPETPDLPEIRALSLSRLPASVITMQATWTAAFGATSYVIETSRDGVIWEELGSTNRTSIQFPSYPGLLYVRVAALNNGQGPWIQDTYIVSHVSGLSNDVPWEDVEWGITWLETFNAVSYTVRVYDNTDSEPVLKRTDIVTERSFTYTYAMAQADGNVVRRHRVEVDANFLDPEEEDSEDEDTPVVLELENEIPAPPEEPASVQEALDSSEAQYRLSWLVPEENDLVRIKVWVSAIDGFDPSVDFPVVDITNPGPEWESIPSDTLQAIPLDSFGGHPAYYWRVAVFDVWGNEISTNVTGQQEIPALEP